MLLYQGPQVPGSQPCIVSERSERFRPSNWNGGSTPPLKPETRSNCPYPASQQEIQQVKRSVKLQSCAPPSPNRWPDYLSELEVQTLSIKESSYREYWRLARGFGWDLGSATAKGAPQAGCALEGRPGNLRNITVLRRRGVSPNDYN